MTAGKCPHCGALLETVNGLTPVHGTKLNGPGSRQNPRHPRDMRPLWSYVAVQRLYEAWARGEIDWRNA